MVVCTRFVSNGITGRRRYGVHYEVLAKEYKDAWLVYMEGMTNGRASWKFNNDRD